MLNTCFDPLKTLLILHAGPGDEAVASVARWPGMCLEHRRCALAILTVRPCGQVRELAALGCGASGPAFQKGQFKNTISESIL